MSEIKPGAVYVLGNGIADEYAGMRVTAIKYVGMPPEHIRKEIQRKLGSITAVFRPRWWEIDQPIGIYSSLLGIVAKVPYVKEHHLIPINPDNEVSDEGFEDMIHRLNTQKVPEVSE